MCQFGIIGSNYFFNMKCLYDVFKNRISPVTVTALCFFIAAFAFTNCDKDNDEPSFQAGSAEFIIDNADFYNGLGIAELIDSSLADDLIVLTDTVLIYDTSGNLVRKAGDEVNNLHSVTVKIDSLPEGNYTVLTWLSAYYKANNYKQKVWCLSGEEKLSTVNITTIYSGISYKYSLGMASATVAINGKAVRTTVTPRTAGSIIDIKIDGFTDEIEDDTLYLFCDTERTLGLYLDPVLADSERWIITDETEDGHADVIAFLTRGESLRTYFTLNHGDDITLSLHGVEGKDNEQKRVYTICNHVELHPADKKIFYMDFDRRSYIPPFYGTTDSLSRWIEPLNDGLLVNDPYLKWGCNLDEVDQYMRGLQFSYRDYSDSPVQSSFDGLWCFDYLIASRFNEIYEFETEDGQCLRYVYCSCGGDNKLTIDMVNASLIKQGYIYSGVYNHPPYALADVFFSADGENEVQTYYFDDGRIAIYYQPTDPDDFQYIINSGDE